MSIRALTIVSTAMGLACAGCVIAPPPPLPPPAFVSGPAPAAQAPAPQADAASGACREFQQTITVGGKPQAAYGTTCQQPDGSWKVVDATQPAPQAASAPPPQ
jgi:hypothetical protein